jgi:RNA polymerase sigma-70 factor (ECF subfamily)
MSIPPDALATSLSLIDQARDHEPEAWRRLCAIYAPLVYGWIRKAGVRQDDAPDVVQEVFRIVATHLVRFRHERPEDTFRGWQLTITRNEIRGHFRRRSKEASPGEGGTTSLDRIHQLPDSNGQADTDDWHDEEAARHEVLRRAAEIIRNDFEPHTWQAFWRSVVEGHETADIAADLGMTPNAIRQARHRILARLKETLGEL